MFPLLVQVVATSVVKLTILTPVGLKARTRAARAHIPVTVLLLKFRHRSFVPPRVGFTKALIPSRGIPEDFPEGAALSPKLLIVAPDQRLSWQYHFRRAEVWKCIFGNVTVRTSDTDEEKDSRILQTGDMIKLAQGERHRIIGNDNFGIIAEIWQHTDPNNPSNEDDIVRLQDDFGRK